MCGSSVLNSGLSTGLISAGFHTGFDCCAMGTSLYAMVIARRKAKDSVFSYGVSARCFCCSASRSLVRVGVQYDRFEVLAGFTNSLFLIFVATFLVIESFHRLYKPPEVHRCATVPRDANCSHRLCAATTCSLRVWVCWLTSWASSSSTSTRACAPRPKLVSQWILWRYWSGGGERMRQWCSSRVVVLIVCAATAHQVMHRGDR